MFLRQKKQEKKVVAFKNVFENDSISVGQHLRIGKVQTEKKNYAVFNSYGRVKVL